MELRRGGCDIPTNYSGSLTYLNEKNNKICLTCSLKHSKKSKAKAVKFKKQSPVTRRFQSRKSRTLALPESLASRSETVQYQAQTLTASLPTEITIQTSHFLSILLQGSCQSHRHDGAVCGGKLQLRETTKTSGKQVMVQLICTRCRSVTEYCSHENNGRIELKDDDQSYQFNKTDVRAVLLVLLAGSTYSVYETMNAGNQRRVTQPTFYRIQRLLCRGIVTFCKQILAEHRSRLATSLQTSNKSWNAQLNGAWSHRGWKARHHTFLVRDKDDNKVVSAITLTKKHVALVKSKDGKKIEKEVHLGNYFGTSKGMEGEAFILALKELEESNLLPSLKLIAADGDSGVPKILRETNGCENIRVTGDPGHQQKNFMRSLKEVFGVRKYKGFPYRIGKFYMRCLKRAEQEYEGHSPDIVKKRKEYFDNLWQHADGHYTREFCPKSCPCNDFYGRKEELQLEQRDYDEIQALDTLLELGASGEDRIEVEFVDAAEIVEEVVEEEGVDYGPSVKVRKKSKMWLDVTNEKEKEMVEKMKKFTKLAGDCASDVLFGLNTCLSECSNARRLVFCRKDRFYYSTYEARSLLSAVLENLDRVDLYQRLHSYFGMEFDAEDEKVVATLEQQDMKKANHSKRKSDVEYAIRKSVLSKQKIETNRLAKDASEARRKARSYTKTNNKTLKGNIFQRKRGRQSQSAMEIQYNAGNNSIKMCERCGTYYTKAHKRCSKKRRVTPS